MGHMILRVRSSASLSLLDPGGGRGCGAVSRADRTEEKEEERERSTLERLSFWRCSVGRVSWRAEE
jgi:hypothetical protein